MANQAADYVPPVISPANAYDMAEVGGLHTNGELLLSAMILTFCVISFGFLYLALRSDKVTPFFLRVYVITVVIFGTLLVVSSAYATSQIAPVVGLFGTIAGYVLGRGDKDANQ